MNENLQKLLAVFLVMSIVTMGVQWVSVGIFYAETSGTIKRAQVEHDKDKKKYCNKRYTYGSSAHDLCLRTYR